MPPQGRINPGQKGWQLITVVTGVIFLVSGILMMSKDSLPPGVFQWAIVAHDVAFILVLLVFLGHVYLATFHPRMTESLRAMLDGKISPKYARSHYARWYEEITAKKK